MKKITLISFASLALGSLLISQNTLAQYQGSYCGDGIVNNGEQCDDGNYLNRDGCSSYCLLEDLTPATISSISIDEEATGILTTLQQVTLTFSEPMDPASINEKTVQIKQHTNVLKTSLELKENKTDLVININQDLVGDAKHAVVIENVKDLAGNVTGLYVRNFTTGTFIDHTPPTVKVTPIPGHYNVTQSVSLTPYIDERTYSSEYVDETAKIYYTTDGSLPTKQSPIFNTPISVKTNSTIKYFAVDKVGNAGALLEAEFTFSCGERPNATKISPYPACNIIECQFGFLLKNNVCILRLEGLENDYEANAATAPLFGSDTPMLISTKPALYVTPQHKGVIPRPIIFEDKNTGTVINFDRDTTITQGDGKAFAGYIRPPSTLSTKDYPINFGYTFKDIIQLIPVDGQTLYFSPTYRITVPLSDRYEEDFEVAVFTFHPETEQYTQVDPELIAVDWTERDVTITADKTSAFFIAQPGQNYNKTVFRDTINHWSRNYVELLYRKGIVKGRDKGIFAPDDILTRAEFTKIALESIGEKVDPLESVESSPFSDVALYAWYAPYIKRAKEIGLINGYPEGIFKPDEPINKAEAIKILMAAFSFNLQTVGARIDNYQDVYTDQWYFPALNFAVQNKLIDGIRLPKGKILTDAFGPGRSITRGEMAKMAIKTMELREELDKQKVKSKK